MVLQNFQIFHSQKIFGRDQKWSTYTTQARDLRLIASPNIIPIGVKKRTISQPDTSFGPLIYPQSIRAL